MASNRRYPGGGTMLTFRQPPLQPSERRARLPHSPRARPDFAPFTPRDHGLSPVTSLSSLKKPCLRTLVVFQLTGTDW